MPAAVARYFREKRCLQKVGAVPGLRRVERCLNNSNCVKLEEPPSLLILFTAPLGRFFDFSIRNTEFKNILGRNMASLRHL
jgi:hypothetical protein